MSGVLQDTLKDVFPDTFLKESQKFFSPSETLPLIFSVSAHYIYDAGNNKWQLVMYEFNIYKLLEHYYDPYNPAIILCYPTNKKQEQTTALYDEYNKQIYEASLLALLQELLPYASIYKDETDKIHIEDVVLSKRITKHFPTLQKTSLIISEASRFQTAFEKTIYDYQRHRAKRFFNMPTMFSLLYNRYISPNYTVLP